MPEPTDSTPPPPPAKPLTADKILELELKQRRKFQSRGEKVRTGCKGIDDYVLGGGIQRGIVMGISANFGGGDGGVEGRLISLHLLASLLLSYSGGTSRSSLKPIAVIIDTTGTFPISLLAQVLSSRLGANSSNEELTRLMEMVALSRVFDLEGLWEVLGELSFSHDPLTPPAKATVEREEATEVTEIQDSESEGFGSSLGSFTSDFFKEEDTGTEILIIDNLTHILTSLLQQKEKSSAHTLITSLSTYLHNLTRTNNVLTILHNTLLPIQSSKPQPPNSNQHQNHNQPLAQLTSPSIFTTPFKPSLGRIFTQFPNLHILISSLPQTRRDAEILYSSESGNRDEEKVEKVCVFEVVSDECPYTSFSGNIEVEGKRKGKEGEIKESERGRFAGREQRWCAFERGGDGVRIVDVDLGFGKKGDGGDGESGNLSGNDVGSVAKIYGFGGRRV